MWKWRVNGRQVIRKLGPARRTGTREGLTRAQAEAQLRDATTYRLRLPKDIPAARVWSLTLHDNQTGSMLQTEQLYPPVS